MSHTHSQNDADRQTADQIVNDQIENEQDGAEQTENEQTGTEQQHRSPIVDDEDSSLSEEPIVIGDRPERPTVPLPSGPRSRRRPGTEPNMERTEQPAASEDAPRRRSTWNRFLSFKENNAWVGPVLLIGSTVIVMQFGIDVLNAVLNALGAFFFGLIPGVAQHISTTDSGRVVLWLIVFVVVAAILWIQRHKDMQSRLVRLLVWTTVLLALPTFAVQGINTASKMFGVAQPEPRVITDSESNDSETNGTAAAAPATQSADESANPESPAPAATATEWNGMDPDTAAAALGSESLDAYTAFFGFRREKELDFSGPTWDQLRKEYSSSTHTKKHPHEPSVRTRREELIKKVGLEKQNDGTWEGKDAISRATYANIKRAFNGG